MDSQEVFHHNKTQNPFPSLSNKRHHELNHHNKNNSFQRRRRVVFRSGREGKVPRVPKHIAQISKRKRENKRKIRKKKWKRKNHYKTENAAENLAYCKFSFLFNSSTCFPIQCQTNAQKFWVISLLFSVMLVLYSFFLGFANSEFCYFIFRPRIIVIPWEFQWNTVSFHSN